MSDLVTAPRETGGEGRDVLTMSADALYQRFHKDAPTRPFHRDLEAVRDATIRALATPRPVEVTEGRPEAFTDEVAGWTTHDSTLSVRYHGASADLLTLFIEESPLPTSGGPARRTTVKRSALLAALRAQPAGGTPTFVLRTDEVEQFAFQCGTSVDTIRRIELEVLTRYKTATGPRAHEVQGGPAPVADAGRTPPLPTKCPRCGYFTADVFSCPTCANPSAPFSAPALPPVGERDKRDAERWRAFSARAYMCSCGPHTGHYLSGDVIDEFNNKGTPSHDEYADALVRLAAAPHPDGQGVGE